MDKDATIMRAGPGANPETTRVRYAAAQISAGGCPFLTMFDMTNADYAAGRAAFLNIKDEASKKVEGVKKELGESEMRYSARRTSWTLSVRDIFHSNSDSLS
jgi:hypothetical protein